jgi:uncharacterized membrane protein (DUF4010 family)
LSPTEGTILGFAAALGSGLLIGIERERRKGSGPTRALAGVRTFALTALSGAGARALNQPLLMAAGATLIGALAAVAYWRNRDDDPGITTEVALLLTYILGATAVEHPMIAAGGSVVVTILLAGRRALHRFSVDTVSETELRDGLLFAAAALILLPALPDRSSTWLAGANPRGIWELVVLFMALQAIGYVAMRATGARTGLALSGLAAGFVSSIATTATLGARARATPALRTACVSGALFSTGATILLLALVVATVLPSALQVLATSLVAAGIAIMTAAAVSFLRQRDTNGHPPLPGRAFSLLYAVGFATALTVVTAVVSMTYHHLGGLGAGIAATVVGTYDVHAATNSVLTLAASGRIPVADVRLPILAALSANTASKIVAAFAVGGRAYGTRVTAGLALMLASAWAPLLLGR